eukprot:scaffold5064_cov121-Cylindrotheca_fusiformis.AAC.9
MDSKPRLVPSLSTSDVYPNLETTCSGKYYFYDALHGRLRASQESREFKDLLQPRSLYSALPSSVDSLLNKTIISSHHLSKADSAEFDGHIWITFVPPAPSMVLKIYLARHGQDEDNAAGILNGHRNQPLTKLGEEQAETVAARIQAQKLTFDAVYSSPLKRTHRTAEILACGKPVETMDLLIERDFGVMSGVPIKKIKERCTPNLLQTDTITYFLSPEGGETFPDVLKRGELVLAEIRKRYGGNGDACILLVTHGDFGKMLYAAYYKLDWVQVLKQFHFGNSEVLLLSEDSSPEEAHVIQIDQQNS